MSETQLYVLQRASAAVMAPLALIHVGVMIWAIRGGLSAGEILSRTQGSPLWAGFYATFVIAASIHASIGLRTVARELARLRGAALNGFAIAVGLGLAILGLRAVWAVTA